MPKVSRRTRKDSAGRLRAYGDYVARIRVPADLAADFDAPEVKQTWPVTMDVAAVERAAAQWAIDEAAKFDAMRRARGGRLQSLSHREIHALAGRWYVEFVGARESLPRQASDWEAVLHAHADHQDDVAEVVKADDWLRDRGYALDAPSRAAFEAVLEERYVDALALLARRAGGDFGRDPVLDTIPPPETPKLETRRTLPGKPVRPWEVFRQWVKEVKPAAATERRWSAPFEAMKRKWPDLRTVTADDAHDWVKSLVTAERSAETVKKVWLIACKTVLSWAVGDRLLPSNPFATVKLRVPRKIKTRESPAFTTDEVRTILTAALAIKVRTPLDAAKRWLPWICAYTGCRAGEAAQMRGRDVVEQGGIWALRITPEAGTTKNRKPRMVPLHEHVAALGFLDYVKTRGTGPLFFDGNDKDRPLEIVKNIGRWVRSIGVTDPELRPNHSWRYTWKIVAKRAGIEEIDRDAVCGHEPASVGQGYTPPTLQDLAAAMKRFPRYGA